MTAYLPYGTQAKRPEARIKFQDDFAGFVNEGLIVVDHFSNFLHMCSDTDVKLNPVKVNVGVSEVKFCGCKLTSKGMHPAEANLDPIRTLVTPTNRKEVCRFTIIVRPISTVLALINTIA